ncbi:MAG: ABC transporter ATP-binding protein [Shewanellaceae bacterium]|nr:ABC transporter ATP-binding protein [Shewanellaceae bacterium]
MSIDTDVNVYHARLDYQGEPIFQDLSFCLAYGQWTCLLGKSGCGKTSLLKLLANLITPVYTSALSTNYPNLSQHIAYMAQADLLLPWLSVLDNVLWRHRLRQIPCQPVHREQAIELLDQVGLYAHREALPHQLSGGMRQRVALVRTLLQDKPIVLMDEPFGALDAITRDQIQRLAFRLLQGKTVLMVTHDPLEALRLSHHAFILQAPRRLLRCALPDTAPFRGRQDLNLMPYHDSILNQLQGSDQVLHVRA